MDNEERESPLDGASDRGGLHTDEESEDDGPGPEPFEDEKPAFPPDLEWLEELYEEENAADGNDLPVVADRSGKMIHAKTARMFKLRRNLDQLDTLHQQKEQNVINAREELKLCRQNIQSLMEQRDCLEREIEQQKRDNSVAVFRLRAQHKHLCQTLQSEEELEGNIDRVLKQHELELTEIEVELGRVSLLREELKEEEQVFQVLKGQKAATRLQHEKQARKNLQLKSQLLRDKQAERITREGTECQKKIEEVQASHKVASKHLKKTIDRMQQQKAEKDQQMKQIQEKRTQAVNSLKLNIAAAHESLQVQQSGARANAPRKEHQHRQLTKSLQTQGTNSSRHMYQQKQLEERKRKQEEVEERQKSKRVEIVAKLLQEEQLVKSRKRHQALVPKPSTTDKRSSQGGATEELLLYLDDRSSSAREEGATVSRDFSDISSSSSASSDNEDLEDTMHQEEDLQSHIDSLIKPEFSGLWDQNYKKFLNEKPTSVQTEVKQEEPAMASPKLNMPKSAKKVHGKQFKGTSFSSNPDIIFFKDFEVGKKYKKKIVLTNVSYMNSHCRLLGVSANLKNCITINLDSPDLLPTGMSCDVHAVFQPMINEDLEGEVQFSSAVGPFSVSVRCTTKRCDMEVDERFIDFGMHVVGQAISRTIILTNKGALATLFSLETSPFVIPESQPVRMLSQASVNTCQETSSKNPTSDNQTSSASIETGEPQLKQECHRLSDKLLQGHTVSEASAADPQAVPEACESIDAVSQMDQSNSEFGDISLGNVRGGEVGPFESIKLEVLFTPTIPGEAKLDFHIKFSDLNSKPIPIQVRGVAASIPVWAERSTIDLKICMFDHIYQDIITIQSRSSIALKLTFEVCSEMKKHMEVHPKTCFIQAQSSFNALLKFQPRCSLAEDAKCYDRDTGVLEVPMTVQVAGQMKPVHFTVQAIVTSSDLQFDRTEVDFGYSSIFQSVKSSVHLTNLSLLPQDFGFLDVPEFIEVQPNDGFGTLLPQETMEIFLIFNAKKAKASSFKLSCKSGINRDFLLSCRAVGFCPPLKLSHSLVKFGATAVGSHSTVVLHLINHKTKNNQPKQPISPGMAPIAAKMFSFALPEDSDISITPSAGSLLLGEKQQIQVTFRPRLREQEIKEEALRLLHRLGPLPEKEFEKNSHTKQQDPVEIGKEKKTSVILNNNMTSDGKTTDQPTESTDTAEIQQGSQLYEKARLSLLCSFTQRFREYSIPCYVLDGEPSENDIETQQPWSTLNTLYLKLQCPAIQPPLVVISNNGHNIIDFHQVAVGEKKIKKIMVQNISHESLDLKSSILDLKGPFSLLNALRCIRPGEIHTLVVAFTPFLEERYCETLEVHSHRMTLEMTLSGDGVVPVVTCIQSGDLLDFGYVFEEESASKVVKLQNSSVVAVKFRVLLASFCPSRTQGEADDVAHQLGSYKDIKVQPKVGTQNYSGLSVFSVVPVEGSIAPGQSKDVTVTFQPDHPSVNYSDRLTVELMNKSKVCVMDLKGAASSHNMYLYGEELLTMPTGALLPPLITGLQLTVDSEVMEKPTVSVLVTLQAGCCTGAITPAVRELQVGCIRSAQPSKKSGEFHWDNLALLHQQGFNVEPSKGTVEAGQTRTIVVTWTPHSGYKPYEMVQTCALLTLKGDERYVYKVTLMASVSTTAD